MNIRDSLKSIFAFMVIVIVISVVTSILLSVTNQVEKSTPLEVNSSQYNISQSVNQGTTLAFSLIGVVLLIILVGIILDALGIDLRKILGDSGI